jgi:hypothetical protein
MPKARTVKLAVTAVAGKHHGNNTRPGVSYAFHADSDVIATIELLEAVFSVGTLPRLYHEDERDKSSHCSRSY